MEIIYFIFLLFLFQTIIGIFLLFIEMIKKLVNHSSGTNMNLHSNNCNNSNYIYRCNINGANSPTSVPTSNTQFNNSNINNINNNLINSHTETNEYSIYTTNNYIMTICEQKFYRFLQSEFYRCNINCSIFPQVDLERIVQVKDNNKTDGNRIKSRTIDFTVVSNENNYKIVCCIELDDYTHRRFDRIKRDTFVNGIFKNVGITLLRVPVHEMYDHNIVEKIKEFL